MSRNFIVYQSRNRLTGTLTRTLDTKHPDAPEAARNGPRYIAFCVEHNQIMRFESHYDAGRAIAHVDEWCAKCQKLIAEGKRLTAVQAAAYVEPLIGDNRHYAYDKRWHDNKGKSQAARKVDSDGMFNQTSGQTYAKATRQVASAKRANLATQAKAKAQRVASAVTTRKAKRSEISKPDQNQLESIDAKTFRKNVASKAQITQSVVNAMTDAEIRENGTPISVEEAAKLIREQRVAASN